MEKQHGNRIYRDALFKRIFGSEEHKDYSLSLYNAVNHTTYTNPEEIVINSLEDVVYMKVKNDVSFLFNQSMVLFEQQATWNPNMPFRMLDYILTEWKGMLEDPYDIYLPGPIRLPVPQCIVFYNGPETAQFREELRLSDLYEGKGKGCLELYARVYNINGNSESDLLMKCRPLYEYTWVIDHIKEKMDRREGKLGEVISAVIDSIPKDFMIYEMMQKEKTEVLGVLMTEFDEKKYKEAVKRYEAQLYKQAVADGKEEGLAEGLAEGRKEGIKNAKSDICLKLLERNMQIDEIVSITGLTPSEILTIQRSH